MSRRPKEREPLTKDQQRAVDFAYANNWVVKASVRKRVGYGSLMVLAFWLTSGLISWAMYSLTGDQAWVWSGAVAGFLWTVVWVCLLIWPGPIARKEAIWSVIPRDLKNPPNRLP